MLTKSEKLVWAAAFVNSIAHFNGAEYAVKEACAAVLAMRHVQLPRQYNHDCTENEMLQSMREMKP